MPPRPEDELIGDGDEYEEDYEEEYEDELEEIEEQELAAGTVTACHCCKCGQPRQQSRICYYSWLEHVAFINSGKAFDNLVQDLAVLAAVSSSSDAVVRACPVQPFTRVLIAISCSSHL
jgi:hypothetical protein